MRLCIAFSLLSWLRHRVKWARGSLKQLLISFTNLDSFWMNVVLTSRRAALTKSSFVIVVARGVLINILVPALSRDSIDDIIFSFLAFDIEEDFKLSDKGDHFDDIRLFR